MRGKRKGTRPTNIASNAAPRRICEIAMEKITTTPEPNAHQSATSSAPRGKRHAAKGLSVVDGSKLFSIPPLVE
jgi:hypothetical protein